MENIVATDDSKEALTPDAFCERFSVGKTKLYEELASGRLKAKKNGSRTLIPVVAAQAWLASLPDYEPAVAA